MADDVFILMTDSYDNYDPHGYCLSEEAAELVAARVNADGGHSGLPVTVQRLAYLEVDAKKVPVLSLSCEIHDDGTVDDEVENLKTDWPFLANDGWSPVHWRWVRAPIHGAKAGRLEVGGTDLSRVRRVFRDQRLRLLGNPKARGIGEFLFERKSWK